MKTARLITIYAVMHDVMVSFNWDSDVTVVNGINNIFKMKM